MIIDNEKLKGFVENLYDAKILVVGDLALDEMVYGDTERISREAPVLILQHSFTKYILGGASNAANNVSSINNGNVNVIGVIGDDYQAEELKLAFQKANVKCKSLVIDKERKTITKTRISGSCSHSITQQIVRIDRETKSPISIETENKLIDEIKYNIKDCDAIILSDYHIGTLSKNVIDAVITEAKKYNKKVVVDAQRDLNKYYGVTSMTPNLPDTEKYVGFKLKTEDDFIQASKILLNESGAKYILITCGADGMFFADKEQNYIHIPVFNKAEVFDVTGAGDTVTALYTMALASNAEPVYAAIIGNIAAGIVVKQYGCATTTVEEIIQAIPNNIVVNKKRMI